MVIDQFKLVSQASSLNRAPSPRRQTPDKTTRTRTRLRIGEEAGRDLGIAVKVSVVGGIPPAHSEHTGTGKDVGPTGNKGAWRQVKAMARMGGGRIRHSYSSTLSVLTECETKGRRAGTHDIQEVAAGQGAGYPKVSVQKTHARNKCFAALHELTSRFITNIESNWMFAKAATFCLRPYLRHQ